MNIDVLFLSQEAETVSLTGRTVVVIDVLRATTTMATALHSGAAGVYPVATVEEARSLAEDLSNSILGGERGGVALPGFAAGNSPYEYMRDKVDGRPIVLTTTNGTMALERAMRAGAERIGIGALVNALAIAKWAVKQESHLTLLCAGTEGTFSLEDAVGAGCIINRCVDLKNSLDLTDAALAAKMMWDRFADNPRALFDASRHGRRLSDLTFDRDLDYCARVDSIPIVGVLRNGMIALND